MQRHASSFMKHDPQGFAKFLRKAHQGYVEVPWVCTALTSDTSWLQALR
jgi:hypothetical protein